MAVEVTGGVTVAVTDGDVVGDGEGDGEGVGGGGAGDGDGLGFGLGLGEGLFGRPVDTGVG